MNAAPPTAELAIRAETDEVRRASSWLEQAGSERGVPPDQIHRLDLCLNEVLANVISYGGPSVQSAPVMLHLEVTREGGSHEAAVTVSDAGVAFDTPGAMPRPAPESLTDAQAGGLGIVMIHSFSDTLRYRRDGVLNRLTFAVRWQDAG
jgi:anti-sigma regulatory factor (Ser/Thr protein kinase)